MSQSLEAISISMLSAALDAASLRQQAISSNIANHGVEGYVPQTVDFKIHMDDARRSFADAAPELRPVFDAAGHPAKVRLDSEMANLAQNSLHYQALVRGLNRHYAILSLAASDGKR
jgi:flagellar basal-body rod protein FlgB